MKSRKEVRFGGLNDVPLNFGGKTTKNWNFEARMGLSSLNDKKIISLKFENYLADHDEIFTDSTHHERAFVRGTMTPRKKNQRWRLLPSLISEKCQ